MFVGNTDVAGSGGGGGGGGSCLASDDFNRSDISPLEAPLYRQWDIRALFGVSGEQGDLNLVSNQVQFDYQSGKSTCAGGVMHDQLMCTDNHEMAIEWTDVGMASSYSYIYGIARSADANDGNDAYMGRTRNDGAVSIYKNVGGARTAIASGSGATPFGVHKLKTNGSTITWTTPTKGPSSVTNSDITTGKYCGFGLQYYSGSSGTLGCDNYTADIV